MNKKFFGSKVGTVVSFIICIVVAFCIWLYAKTGIPETEEAFRLGSLIFRG